MSRHNCRVCGYYIDDLPWGKDGNCPTYEICPCCGDEFGTAKYRIPDELTNSTLREIKNVSYLDYTPQLQDSVIYSQQHNLQMIL